MWRKGLRLPWLCLWTPRHIVRSVRLPLLTQSAEQLCIAREYSGQTPPSKQTVLLGSPNPFIRLRIEFYRFLIQKWLGQDFNLEEFSQGALQAFLLVSRLLSERKFDVLENLVDEEILKDLQDKCSELSDNCRRALAAESHEILCLYPFSIGIDCDEEFDPDGTNFAYLYMRFWYWKHVDLLDDEIKGKRMYQLATGNRNLKNTQRVLTANYLFRREFTKGVKPEWIITKITYPNLLE